MNQRAFTIGIIAGSGPEAGIDLWAKVLKHSQALMGKAYRGDLDAPRVVILSEPDLGLSMDLRANEGATRAAMMAAVRQIAPQVDVFSIACNTLNWFVGEIEELLPTIPNAGRLLSFQSVIAKAIAETNDAKIGLLAAQPVLRMDAHSAYAGLARKFDVEIPGDINALHALIEDVKRLGAADPSLSPRFVAIATGIKAETLVLACTELPLIATAVTGKTLLDVTDCVARELALLAYRAKEKC